MADGHHDDSRIDTENTADRIVWIELPELVRNEVEQGLRGQVRAAYTQPGGFSHALSGRLELRDGRTIFARAINCDDPLIAPRREPPPSEQTCDVKV